MRLWKTAALVLVTLPAALAAGAGFDITLPAPYAADVVNWAAPDGDDGAAGTESAPLATLAGAARKAAEVKKDAPEKSVAVYFKEGIYPLTETAVFEGLRAPCEKPVL